MNLLNDSEWPELLTISQVAEIFQVSCARAKSILGVNDIPVLRLNRQTWRVRKSDLMQFLYPSGGSEQQRTDADKPDSDLQSFISDRREAI